MNTETPRKLAVAAAISRSVILLALSAISLSIVWEGTVNLYGDVTLRWQGSSRMADRNAFMIAAGMGLAWWTVVRGWKSTWNIFAGKETLPRAQALSQIIILPVLLIGMFFVLRYR